MKVKKQCVSLELAKRLKQLNCKQESLFYWVCHYIRKVKDREFNLYYGKDENDQVNEHISAFTSAELGELLPKTINFGKTTISYWEWRQRCIVDEFEVYFDSYVGVPEEPSEKYFRADTEADARAKTLCFLLENKFIKPTE